MMKMIEFFVLVMASAGVMVIIIELVEEFFTKKESKIGIFLGIAAGVIVFCVGDSKFIVLPRPVPIAQVQQAQAAAADPNSLTQGDLLLVGDELEMVIGCHGGKLQFVRAVGALVEDDTVANLKKEVVQVISKTDPGYPEALRKFALQ